MIRQLDGTYTSYPLDDFDSIDEREREFEDGCADLLDRIQDIRKWSDLGPIDRDILNIIEDLINLL